MGYDPSFFGPPSWHVIHTLAGHLLLLQSRGEYTPQHAAAFKRVIESLKKLVPCENCRRNYIINLRVIDVDAYGDDPMNLFQLTCDLHNLVNAETKKAIFPIEKALERYRLVPYTQFSRGENGASQRYWCNPKNFENEMWRMIHCLAGNLVMKQEEKKESVELCTREFVKFITNLAPLIPCDDFRAKFGTALRRHPLKNHTASGRDIFNWTVTIHNEVNTKYKRPMIALPAITKMYGLQL